HGYALSSLILSLVRPGLEQVPNLLEDFRLERTVFSRDNQKIFGQWCHSPLFTRRESKGGGHGGFGLSQAFPFNPAQVAQGPAQQQIPDPPQRQTLALEQPDRNQLQLMLLTVA